MKRLHIFKAGKHTSSNGTELEFTAEDLQAMVASYNPEVHEAPIVVGHPADNGPAFGWIKGLSFADGNVYAEPHQVNDDFGEAVGKGAYKKISASLYTKDHPANPTPGSYYVRHVGFLGAQPPAIKGLEAVQFSEDGEVVEFSQEWETAGVFRRLREFFIEKFGIEDADKAIPGYLVESAEDAARMPKEPAQPSNSFAGYSEPEPQPGENAMTPEELQAAQDKLQAEQEAHQAAVDAHNATVAAFNESQETARKAAIHTRVDALVESKKVLPADAAGIKSFAEGLSTEATIDFGEGDSAEKLSPLEFYLRDLEKGSNGVDFGEASADDGTTAEGLTPEQLGAKAAEYREEQAAKGITITATQAVQHVQANQ